MVFISYSHDSPEHEASVLALANRLGYALFLRDLGRAADAENLEARFKASGR